MIKIKRVYEPASETDGFRILVDRLWPRGLTKEKTRVHLWLKEIAPSDTLRKWFAHDPDKWNEFKKKYFEELKDKSELFKIIKNKIKGGTVTFVYGAKDIEHNNARALKEYLSSGRS